MPKRKNELPRNVVDAIDKWAIKNCDLDANASQVMDHRIARESARIRATWTSKEERQRRVFRGEDYVTPSYQPIHHGAVQKAHFKPEENRK